MPLHIETPALRSRKLSQETGKDVWLKLEALQPPGSFKIRGIGTACEEYLHRGKSRLLASSGGNAGLAVAYAGRILDVPVTVVVPETTPDHALALLRLEGAEVIVYGSVWAEANDFAQSLIDHSTGFIHPFDDPLLWKGHATMIDEMVDANIPFDCVVLSVGGGGLFAGVMEGLERNGRKQTPVIAVETLGADSMAHALATGQNVPLPAITSVAKSLGASQVCERAFELACAGNVISRVVSDLEALDACSAFLSDHRILVEPACGAALAVAYDVTHRGVLAEFQTPLFIVCGGATATYPNMLTWRDEIIAREQSDQ